MTFKDQVRWSRKWGATLLLLGLLIFGALYILHTNGRNDLAFYWANFCTAIVGLAVVLLLFGGLLRPMQKNFYHYALEANHRTRTMVAANPIARWLWWLDSEGRDRDA
jgi:hypothetical protein